MLTLTKVGVLKGPTGFQTFQERGVDFLKKGVDFLEIGVDFPERGVAFSEEGFRDKLKRIGLSKTRIDF